MPKIDDEPLGGSDYSTDATAPLPEPEEFDFAAWLGGVRPTRRAVRLYARADVLGRMEEIAGLIEDAEGEQADALVDEFEELQRTFEASGRWFFVEARSAEWVEDFRRVYKRDHGIKGDPGDRQRIAIILAQLAEQIVSPAGVTAEMLERLHEANAGELNKLVVAVTMANDQVAQSAAVLKLDFSSRRPVRDPG